jgi:hypothetical protein
VKGRVKRGSSLQSAYPQKLAYIPSIRNSPWAKFTMSITPKMSVSPTAMRAYTSPMSRPERTVCRRICAVTPGRG